MKLELSVACAALGLAKAEQGVRGLQSASYSEAEAYQAAAYSGISTCWNDAAIINWECTFCTETVAPGPPTNEIEDITVFTSSDDIGRGFIGYDRTHDRIVMSFAGTTNSAQQNNNLRLDLVTPSYCSDCQVAEGFYDAFTGIGEETLTALGVLSDRYGTTDVLATGHSLGGAIASHFAAEVATRFPGQYNILGYTFGAPRIGNTVYAAWFHETVPDFFRVVNYNDPVPNLIASDGGNYAHSPQEIWYPEVPVVGQPPERYIVLSDTDGEDPNGQRQDCDATSFFTLCLNFDYHNTYLNLPVLTSEEFNC